MKYILDSCQFKSKSHIVINCHMWIKSIALENHSNISFFWWHVVYQSVANPQFTFCNIFQTCNHTQCCGFTTAGSTNKNDELFVCYFKVKTFYNLHAIIICLFNIFK